MRGKLIPVNEAATLATIVAYLAVVHVPNLIVGSVTMAALLVGALVRRRTS